MVHKLRLGGGGDLKILLLFTDGEIGDQRFFGAILFDVYIIFDKLVHGIVEN